MTTFLEYLLAQIDHAHDKLAATVRGLGESCERIARRTDNKDQFTDQISSQANVIGELQAAIRVLYDTLENFGAFAKLNRLK